MSTKEKVGIVAGNGGCTGNSNKKNTLVDGLFEEVQEELNEDVVKDAKIKIKELLQQRLKAEKVLKNLDRQIDDLKLKINNDLS